MTTRTTTTPYYVEQRLFFSAFSIFFMLFGFYVYFISISVVHVIARKEVEREIAHLNSYIGDLESAYIAARQAVTEETLTQHGFVAASSEKIYVKKANPGLVFAGTSLDGGSIHDEN